MNCKHEIIRTTPKTLTPKEHEDWNYECWKCKKQMSVKTWKLSLLEHNDDGDDR